MTTPMTLKDGLLSELRDLYNAENQLLKALPKMQKKATSEKLKEGFHVHLVETEGQIERLDEIAGELGEKLSGKVCKAMQGLIEEGSEVIDEKSENAALIDSLLIGAARRVEHYEIAAYSTARAMAEQLGLDSVVELLTETLDEEVRAEETLSTLLTEEVVPQAYAFTEEGENSSKAATATKKSTKKVGVGARMFCLWGVPLCLAGAASLAQAENIASERRENERQSSEYKGDDTGRKIRDRGDGRLTADDQKMGGVELEVLAQIRREISANSDLSTNARNVKIVVANGSVFLRGPVSSLEERNWIGMATGKAAPNYKVLNELEVTKG